MLRSFSIPADNVRLYRLGVSHEPTAYSVPDLSTLVAHRSGSSIDEDNSATRSWLPGGTGATLWEDEGSLLVVPTSSLQRSNGKGQRWRASYGSTELLRSWDSMRNFYRDEEEECVLDSSDIAVEDKDDVIAELVHSKSCLKKINSDLQKSVDVTEDSNSILRSENAVLRNQIRGMKKSIQDAEPLLDELDEMRGSLAEQEMAKAALQATVKQLEKENESLNEQIDGFVSEVSIILPEGEINKKMIKKLNSLLQDLQKQMEETRLVLDQKDELIRKKVFVIEELENSISEYSSIAQDLREKVKTLEDQLAETLINGSDGGFQTLGAPRCMSLYEELGLVPHVWIEEEPSDEEEDADKKLVELAPLPCAMKKSWWQAGYESLKRVVCTTGACSLVLVAVMLSAYCDNPGLNCADILWSTSWPHISIHHNGLPPM